MNTLPSQEVASAPLIQQIEDRPISGPALLELLRAVLDQGAPFRFQAPGFSMAPFIRDGDVVTIAPLNGRAPRVGEVVAFVQPARGRLALHRVIARRGATWLIRGDNSPEPDGLIPRENILGVVTRMERDGRTVRLGLGGEGRLIAWLNARDWLLPLKTKLYFPLRVASAILRRLQQTAAFRAWVKRFRPAYDIPEASARDLMTVYAWTDPSGERVPRPRSPHVTDYVAKRGQEVIGFVQLVRHPEAHFPYVGYWLFSLRVRTRYRGMGIGEALTRRVIDQAQAEGAKELFLNVFEDNRPALALYRKLGFERVALPVLEEEFAAEGQREGRRRVTLRRSLP
jgi:ribosomal protein S18 acetylase RimI-like enzyme